MENRENGYILLTGTANPPLANAVGALLKKEVTNPISYFRDGEVRVHNMPHMRKKSVYIIQPTSRSGDQSRTINDSIMELMLMIDAARRASAQEITAVVPYFGYARQDRKEQPRVPISGAWVASTLENSGANRIVTIDVHSKQSQGFIKGPWDDLSADYTLVPALRERTDEETVIVSPDAGGIKKAKRIARLLKVQRLALVHKERNIQVNNASNAEYMIGSVEGMNAQVIDDMIDAGSTLFNAAQFLEEGRAKSIMGAVTHGLFTGDSLKRLSDSSISEIITTDTVEHRGEVIEHPKIKIVSVAPLIAEGIGKLHDGDSISENLSLKEE